jgi:hypothetical protein
MEGHRMRCVFCKCNSDGSKSVEHIIPESLGNKSHFLPSGVVCDRCNNYFARKVEQPFLESPAIRLLRFHQTIENKRGRIPSVSATISPGFPATLTHFARHNFTSVAVTPDALAEIAKSPDEALILLAHPPAPKDQIVSRFMAKVALESMAARLVQMPDGLEYICDETQLDPIRDHARFGRIEQWPVHIRRIYDPDAAIVRPDGQLEQIVHESEFLVTPSSEWYFVLAIFGLELAVNLGGPEISGYEKWLIENGQASVLYGGKNSHYSMPQHHPARDKK